jgi:hypothetical protein
LVEPLPPLKFELVGSQAMSPAAAITGSVAASATSALPAGLNGPGNNEVRPINATIETQQTKRRKKFVFIYLSLGFRWASHKIGSSIKDNFCE